MKRRLLGMICGALFIAGCTSPATPAPALPALFTDRLGTTQDLVPTQTEIAAAQTALGAKGFIGIVACNLSSEYHATVPKAAQALADKLGLRIEVFDSETKADRQIAAVENFVSKGARAIAICAIDPKVVEKAVKRNITLAALPRLARRWGFLDRSGERQSAQHQAEALQIKAPSLASPVRVLSGGNQQKTALARWLAAGARALILLEPTQGIDVGVKFEIYDLIARLARSGTAILLISSDLPEVMGLAQRVLVMRRGKIVAEFAGEPATAAAILRAAAGV